jgi:hypothetical protein
VGGEHAAAVCAGEPVLSRRSFLGALATIVAAPRLLAKLAPAPPLRYEEMPLGLIDVTETASLDGLTLNHYPVWEEVRYRPGPFRVLNNVMEG